MSQEQLDRIESKLDELNDSSTRVAEFLFSTGFWKKFEANLKILDKIAEKTTKSNEEFNQQNSNSPLDTTKICTEFLEKLKGKDWADMPSITPLQRELLAKRKTPFSLFKRVEYFVNGHLDMKSNRTVEYYLFDFILYRKVYKEKDSKSLFPVEE